MALRLRILVYLQWQTQYSLCAASRRVAHAAPYEFESFQGLLLVLKLALGNGDLADPTRIVLIQHPRGILSRANRPRAEEETLRPRP
jgi:hypothetical protein